MTPRRRLLSDTLIAVVLAGTLLLVAGATPSNAVYLPAVGRLASYPQSLHIPADYVLDGVAPAYVDGVLFVAVETVTKDHEKVCVVFKDAAGGLTPVLTVPSISASPSLFLSPDGRLLVAGSDREGNMWIEVVPR